jgi:para-aminobenzoate synthetase/4-amino-4-deoxychorismate lyase
VPIRTLLLQGPGEDGVRKGELRVGAGIVHDSVAVHEYEECLLKARFLTGLSQQFELFETMYATREAGCRHADLHMRRLSASAAYFGFRFDEGQARMLIGNACAALAAGAHRLRLALNHAGQFALQSAPLSPLQVPVKLLLAPEPVDRGDLFLRHKTTVRERYDAAWRTAEAQGAFDMLFFNKDGELAEGARSNVFVKMQGRWHTPPLDAGLLPGVMRSVLLSDSAWNATERRLTVDDLRAAEGIVVCNALRGAVPAILA